MHFGKPPFPESVAGSLLHACRVGSEVWDARLLKRSCLLQPSGLFSYGSGRSPGNFAVASLLGEQERPLPVIKQAGCDMKGAFLFPGLAFTHREVMWSNLAVRCNLCTPVLVEGGFFEPL